MFLKLLLVLFLRRCDGFCLRGNNLLVVVVFPRMAFGGDPFKTLRGSMRIVQEPIKLTKVCFKAGKKLQL